MNVLGSKVVFELQNCHVMVLRSGGQYVLDQGRPVLAKEVVLDQDVFRCHPHDTTVRFASNPVAIPWAR